jgi:hypothetical protein
MTTQARAAWERQVSEIEERAERYIALRNQGTGIGLNAQQEVRGFAEWCDSEDEAAREAAEQQTAPGGVKR